MGIARSLEKRLERLADGLSAAVFRGRMHPVDLANRLVRQADLLVQEEAGGPAIPNRYAVAVNERDLDPTIDVGRLKAELNLALSETAADRGWRIRGPIDVDLSVDGRVGKGSIKCAASSDPAPMQPWSVLAEHRGDRQFEIDDNRCVIGRSDDCDIQLDDPEVSRHHAVIFRKGGRLWVQDLGSANGSRVNGIAVGAEPLEIGPGDMLSFGPATFAVRIL
jgi:hypothetical protein